MLAVAGLALAACSKPNPNHCRHKLCESGFYCDEAGSGTCLPVPKPKPDASPGRPDSDEPDSIGPSNVDVLPPADAPVPDSDPVDLKPEAPEVGECSTDNECVGSDKFCRDNKCRPCDAAGALRPSCPSDRPYCSKAFECLRCNLAEMDFGGPVCMGATPFCNAELGNCVQCLDSKSCMGATPICSTAKTCVGCGSPMPPPPAPVEQACALRDPALPGCKQDGTCVECAKHTDCKAPDKPACNPTTNKCEPCTSDQQCAERGGGPGICLLDPDGRNGKCATEEQTVYVMNKKPGCVDAGPGAAATPFCEPARAVATVKGSKRVMLLKGPDAFKGFRISGSVMMPKEPIWIVGVGGAVLVGGLDPGVGLAIGPEEMDVRVRSLEIRNSEREGVLVTGNATVRLNRVVLTGNRVGGLRTMAEAGFDVANSVFDSNGTGDLINSPFGGVQLQAPRSGRPGRFRLNTVINNANGGVTCFSGIPLTGLLVFGNTISGCQVDPNNSRIGLPPDFADGYHLRETAPCREAVPAGSAPADDLDGQLRDGNNVDCGADEWKP